MFSSAFSLKTLVAILPLLSAANAHMIMSSPVPYGKSTLDNSPLIADGSDFPCKQRSGVYDLEGAANNIVIGEPQTLSFIGSAVHGGGSCQVSLTKDQQPTKDSQWQVIHSIQGNCPSNVTGNLDANAAGTGAAVFQYTVPAGIEAGDYTIAWSWVNKVGNREFYMNCGPATITSPSKKRYAPAPKVRRQSSFPALFVANLAGVSNGCATTEGIDTQYPDPGSSVQNGNIGVDFGPPTGCTGGDTSTSSGGNSTSSGGPSSESSGPESSPAAGSASAAAPSASNDGVFASGAGGASSAASPAAATSTAFVSPVPAATSVGAGSGSGGAAPSVASASAAAPSSTGASSTSGAMAGSCTDGNAYHCLADGLSFQRCGSGTWTSPPTQMPAGTTCTPGVSDNFQENVVVTKVRRGAHHQRVRRSEKIWAA